jgi:hypothetical protein
MTHDPRTHIYIARKPACNCVVGLCSYAYNFRDSVASYISEWVKEGLIVSSVTLSEYKSNPVHAIFGCTHGDVIADNTQQPSLFSEPKEE